MKRKGFQENKYHKQYLLIFNIIYYILYIQYKKSKPMHVCFPFHHGTFTRRVFKFCHHNQSTEKAPASQFYSSQHLDNGREKTMSYVYTVSGINTV